MLGLFLLIGVVMKNAILMIDVALQLEREKGLTPQESIREACLLRLRPILMTTLAALLGALPLVLERRRGLGAAAAARHRDRRRAAREPGADALHDARRVPVSRSAALVERPPAPRGGDGALSGGRWRLGVGCVAARLLVGLVVLITAEVFSGASLGAGLWSPFTAIVTYPLYFAHFFLLTTFALRTGRTGLGALYFWGVLFGLYESWVTKVIWAGYDGNGVHVIGSLGPFGISELTMVFLYHPVASFIVPLAVTCVLAPALRAAFPDLAWLTGGRRRARIARASLVTCFGLIMGVNSGGPINLAMNLAFALVLLAAGLWAARPAFASGQAIGIVRPRHVGERR